MDSSHFAKLPLELCSEIFEYALTYPQPLEVHGDDSNNPNALPQTCRQIHHESSYLIYQLNTFNLSSRHLIEDFTDGIGPCYSSLLRRLIIEVDSFAGYFGQDVNNFRNSIHCIIRDTADCLPKSCEIVVWPVVLVNRRQYSQMEFERLMGIVELNVSDVEQSLRRAVRRLEKAMKAEERQEIYQDLFWAKRLYGEYLQIKEQACDDGGTEEEGDEAKNEHRGKAKTIVDDSLWSKKIFEDL